MEMIPGSNKAFVVMQLIFIIVVASETIFAWNTTATFEGGKIGTKAEGATGFNGCDNATLYSNDRSAAGSNSAKMQWTSSTNIQGYFPYPQPVSNGQEIWARGYYYFKSPWSWGHASGNSGFIKILRIHIANSAGTNVGYHSIIAYESGQIIASNEPAGTGPILNAKFDIDTWQCLEIYVKLSTSSPVFRMWKNGILIHEDKSHITLLSGSDRADFTYVMSSWNGGAPQAQTEYVDEFVITTDRPSQVDSYGNPMIGPVGSPVQVLTSISIEPSNATVAIGGSQQFTATAKDQNGNIMTTQPMITWSVNGGGVISPSGRFTALNNTGGPYTVTASSNGKSSMARVSVTSPSAIGSARASVLLGANLRVENATPHSVLFKVTLDGPGMQRLLVLNLAGQKLWECSLGPPQRQHLVRWDRTLGRNIESGVYFAQLVNEDQKKLYRFSIMPNP